MFCSKCGAEISSENIFCGNCGFQLKKEEAEIDTIDKNEVIVDIVQAESNNSAADLNSSEKSAAPATVKLDSRLVAVFAAIILVLSVIAGVLVYMNSDSYKIKKSVEFITSAKYYEAEIILQDVYTPQAMAIRKFIDVEKAKDNFVYIASSDVRSDTSECYSEFKKTLEEFTEGDENHYLPDELKKHYNCYKYAFDFVYGFVDSEASKVNSYIYNVQEVMLNEVMKRKSSKSGSTFTLREFQKRVDNSREAVKGLKEIFFSEIEVTDADVIAYCHTQDFEKEDGTTAKRIFLSSYLDDLIKDLINISEGEISYCQDIIDENLEEFDLDADLYRTSDPDPNYTAYVGTELNEIGNYGNMGRNRVIILNYLRRDILINLLEGYAVAS